MSSLIIDAWTREAEEASQGVEDLESRIKTSSLEQWILAPYSTQSKLKELCVKLDRLESLLRNPPSNPLLTDEDLNFRWSMLSDIQQRTRAVARRLCAIPSTSNNRKTGIPAITGTKDLNESSDFSDQDTDQNVSPKDESMLLMPLLRLEDSNESEDRIKSMNSFQKGCCTIWVILGVVLLLLGVVLLCATS